MCLYGGVISSCVMHGSDGHSEQQSYTTAIPPNPRKRSYYHTIPYLLPYHTIRRGKWPYFVNTALESGTAVYSIRPYYYGCKFIYTVHPDNYTRRQKTRAISIKVVRQPRKALQDLRARNNTVRLLG
eukprot:4940313-Pleurochrysis_carterae.AAC.2